MGGAYTTKHSICQSVYVSEETPLALVFDVTASLLIGPTEPLHEWDEGSQHQWDISSKPQPKHSRGVQSEFHTTRARRVHSRGCTMGRGWPRPQQGGMHTGCASVGQRTPHKDAGG